jgi:GntR family transcriptional repressor for pyruvate dehydrogenase complex
VREAVKALVAEGLVEVRHGHGTFVADGNGDAVVRSLAALLNLGEISLEEVYGTRQFIEPALAAFAAEHHADEGLARLRAVVRRMEDVDCPPGDFYTIDRAFHLAVAELASNRVVTQLVHALWELKTVAGMETIEDPVEWEPELMRHVRVFEAIQARDPQRAHAAMVQHFQEAIAANRARAQRTVPPEAGGTSAPRERRPT